jgi:hypothetical protein
MTFLCSKKSDEKTASISFSGSYASKFGFTPGCKVAVNISKGLITIRLIENIDTEFEDPDIKCIEG